MDEAVSAWRDAGIGRIRLRRPAAINALTLAMIRSIRATLDGWSADPAIGAIVLDGAGDRGFCAGGDIRFVHDHAGSAPERVRQLWAEEYTLDAVIASYPKPIVALADGITMGGGIGLASHASHRVVTERSSLAMPEVQIGLAPDVGGLWLLARAPGELGTHAALTGARVGPNDAVALGLADCVVPTKRVDALLRRLHDADPGSVLADAHDPAAAEPASLPAARTWIDECYAGDDPRAIIERLVHHPDPAATAAARAIRSAAPTSVAVTLAGLRRAAAMSDVAQCFVQDYRVSSHFLTHPDLVEGIRARVIDKDGMPRWSPASLADVPAAHVASFFDPVGPDLEPGVHLVARRHPVRDVR